MAYPSPDPETAGATAGHGLPAGAIVVRGGVMKLDRTKASAEAALHEVGVHGLSVWSMAELSAEDIVRLARSHDTEDTKHLPHGSMRTSTVERVEAGGFGLRPDSPEGHYLLTLPSPPTDQDWDALDVAFDDAVPTPARQEA